MMGNDGENSERASGMIATYNIKGMNFYNVNSIQYVKYYAALASRSLKCKRI